MAVLRNPTAQGAAEKDLIRAWLLTHPAVLCPEPHAGAEAMISWAASWPSQGLLWLW